MENVIYNLASVHGRSAIRLSVGCLVEKGFLSEMLAELGVETSLLPRMAPGVSVIFPWQLIKFIKKSDCDIVHTHSGSWSIVAAACAFIPRIRLVYTDHGRFFPEIRHRIFSDRVAIHFTDKVVAVGDPLRRYLIEKVGIPANKVITIRNGIDTERFSASAENRKKARREFGLTGDNVVIGVVARLSQVKNHRLLFNAFKVLNRDFPQTRLLIIGDGPLRIELEQLVESYRLKKVVIFAGDRSDVPVLLSGVDIATLCSLSEGISLTILEAMSTGLPTIVTDVGGNHTIIKDGVNGFLIESNDIESYVARLVELINSPTLRGKIGRNARNHITSDWSLEKMAESYEELYRGLLQDV